MVQCGQGPLQRSIVYYNWMWSALISILLVFVPFAAAQTLQVAKGPLEVHVRPNLNSKILFLVAKGEEIKVWLAQGNFHQVGVFRGGKWRRGYVSVGEFARYAGPKPKIRGELGYGAGYVMSSLTQGSKSFTSKDQVQYTTSEYQGSTQFPLATVQFGFRNFWRFQGVLRKVAYEAAATPNVPGSSSRSVEITLSMFGFNAQHVWSWSKTPLFFGGGLEIAQTYANTFKLDGVAIDLGSENEPLYLTPHLLVGAQWALHDHWSVSVEGRLNQAINQSPPVSGYDFGFSLIFWP